MLRPVETYTRYVLRLKLYLLEAMRLTFAQQSLQERRANEESALKENISDLQSL